jgi:hypothetical protein
MLVVVVTVAPVMVAMPIAIDPVAIFVTITIMVPGGSMIGRNDAAGQGRQGSNCPEYGHAIESVHAFPRLAQLCSIVSRGGALSRWRRGNLM